MSVKAFPRLRLQPRSLVSIKAVHAIKNAIADGRLKPGEQLPPERELARRLGVSRTSLRDALKMLSGMGLVDVRRSHGVFVARPEERLSRQLAHELLLDAQPLGDLFDIRLALETKAAAWAAERATDEQLATIAQCYEDLCQRVESEALIPEAADRLDGELHRLIIQATGNGTLLRLVERLRDLLEQSRGRPTVIPGRITASLAEMGRIVRALCRRDGGEAELEMQAHLRASISAWTASPAADS